MSAVESGLDPVAGTASWPSPASHAHNTVSDMASLFCQHLCISKVHDAIEHGCNSTSCISDGAFALLMRTRCTSVRLTSRHCVDGKPKNKSCPHVAIVRQRWCGQQPDDLEVSHYTTLTKQMPVSILAMVHPTAGTGGSTRNTSKCWCASVIERGCQASRVVTWQTLRPSLLFNLQAGTCTPPSGAGALLLRRKSG